MSERQEYCLAMLRWSIQALRQVECHSVEEYQYQLNTLGYLGNCYLAEGGTQEELASMDTEKWFYTPPRASL